MDKTNRNIPLLIINATAILCFCVWEFYLFLYSLPLLAELLVAPARVALHLSLYCLIVAAALGLINFIFTRFVVRSYSAMRLLRLFAAELLLCLAYTAVLTWYFHQRYVNEVKQLWGN
ncbi:MAG: hypothetical protein AB1458_11895 [Bacteroidota bacterium]